MRQRILLVALVLAALAAASGIDAGEPGLTAVSAVIMNSDGLVLWEKNPAFRCPPASTAKVMTALVAIEKLPLDSWLKVSKNAEETEPSKAGIKAGEEFRTGDLICALLMNSANDVAVCIAENAAGSEARFAAVMNETAASIGASRTVFKNASGLPAEGQMTTARDLALLMKKAYANEIIVKAMKTRNKVIASREGREIELRNHNRLLWDGNLDVVLKTGYTRASKHCYVGFMGPGGRDGFFAFLMAKKPWNDARILACFASGGGARIEFNRAALSPAQIAGLQRALQKCGFNPGPADGVFGPKTQSALEEFQKRSGLKQDGLAGPATLKKLGIS